MKTQKRRFIVVGNADLPRDLSREIDSADYVLRFNQPRLLDGWTGTKTNCLMMSNCNEPMQERLSDPNFMECEFFKQAQTLTFVYHPYIIKTYCKRPNLISRLLRHQRSDWTNNAVSVFGKAYKDIVIKSAKFYLEACAEIGIEGNKLKELFPSTGYLGIWDFLHRLDLSEWEIYICGFTWQGWVGHDWSAEKKWVHQRINEGICRFLE